MLVLLVALCCSRCLGRVCVGAAGVVRLDGIDRFELGIDGWLLNCLFQSFLLGFEIIEFIFGIQLYGSFTVEGLKNCFSSLLAKCLFIIDRNLAPISVFTLSL